MRPVLAHGEAFGIGLSLAPSGGLLPHGLASSSATLLASAAAAAAVTVCASIVWPG